MGSVWGKGMRMFTSLAEQNLCALLCVVLVSSLSLLTVFSGNIGVPQQVLGNPAAMAAAAANAAGVMNTMPITSNGVAPAVTYSSDTYMEHLCRSMTEHALDGKLLTVCIWPTSCFVFFLGGHRQPRLVSLAFWSMWLNMILRCLCFVVWVFLPFFFGGGYSYARFARVTLCVTSSRSLSSCAFSRLQAHM